MIRKITPDWPLQGRVSALTTTRIGGTSQPPYDTLNLALHVGDQRQQVIANRNTLCHHLSLSEQPKWLQQTHSDLVVNATSVTPDQTFADASYTTEPGVVCAVLTADCLPIVFSDKSGSCIGIAHAGWRGLLQGIIQRTVEAMSTHSRPTCAWLGPAIGPRVFEVGDDVYMPYTRQNSSFKQAFTTFGPGRWKLDIYQAAKIVLAAADIFEVYGGDYCTFTDDELFYSYRRSHRTGRMATLVWVK